MKLPIVIVSALAALVLCASPSGGQVAAVPIVALKVSPLAFSPNGDGVKDTLRASIDVDVPVTLLIEISDARGNVVYTNAPGASVNAGTASFHWNGKLGVDGQERGSAGREVHAHGDGDRSGHGDEQRSVGEVRARHEAAADAVGKRGRLAVHPHERAAAHPLPAL